MNRLLEMSNIFYKNQNVKRSIVYNLAIVYKRQNFLKIAVHVIIIDQCNQIAQ